MARSKAYFVVLITIWNLMLFLSKSKKGVCGRAIENCTFGKHPAVLAKLNLLANKPIYWSRGRRDHMVDVAEWDPPCMKECISPILSRAPCLLNRDRLKLCTIT